MSEIHRDNIINNQNNKLFITFFFFNLTAKTVRFSFKNETKLALEQKHEKMNEI